MKIKEFLRKKSIEELSLRPIFEPTFTIITYKIIKSTFSFANIYSIKSYEKLYRIIFLNLSDQIHISNRLILPSDFHSKMLGLSSYH